MPLHPNRLKERGFNQSLLIARPLCRALKLPLLYQGIERIIHTPPQHRLKAHARQQNVENAFYTLRDFSGQRLVIVDDVITTSQTAHALANTLKKAGASHVEIWCIARVMRSKVDENNNNRYITLP
jgi:ComF family protein